MIEIHPRLFVGALNDCGPRDDSWVVVHACKEPCHRASLGYTGRAAPKSDPEYLIAERDNNLVLNLVDAQDPRYIPHQVMYDALQYMRNAYDADKSVLVHCNQGHSRSPALALLFLRLRIPFSSDFKEGLALFQEMYPPFQPSAGILGYLQGVW